MKKQDLKHGMVVETRWGMKYLITEGHDHLVLTCLPSGSVYDVLEHYNDDLMMTSGFACLLGVQKESDIVKVYSDYTCSNLLWERKDKPSLTEDEINLLRMVQRHGSKYEWIARDKSRKLFLYHKKPIKVITAWSDQQSGDLIYSYLGPFDDMFKFIKWEDEEPYSISELLKGANY